MGKVFLAFIGIMLGLAIVFTGLDYAFGWNKVFYTKTVGKAQQNAEREVFEETQSYVEGKRQEAAKLYREYQTAEADEKAAICITISNNFANFDDDYLQGPIRTFVEKCKYGY